MVEQDFQLEETQSDKEVQVYLEGSEAVQEVQAVVLVAQAIKQVESGSDKEDLAQDLVEQALSKVGQAWEVEAQAGVWEQQIEAAEFREGSSGTANTVDDFAYLDMFRHDIESFIQGHDQ